MVCLCPQGKLNGCVHTRFLTEHGEKYFDNADGLVGECTAIRSSPTLTEIDSADTDAVLFSREIDGDTISNLFSVQTPGQRGIKNRCIVTYRQRDGYMGVCQRWKQWTWRAAVRSHHTG